LDEDSFITYGTGHKYSLKIIFNIETHEYLKAFTSAYGVRMVFHERGTFPLPDDEGLSLSSHSETHIGLRMSRISRLGGKYGKCTDGHEFKKKYKVKYTVPLCRSICEIEKIKSRCMCKQLSYVDLLNHGEGIRVCSTDGDFKCIREVNYDMHVGNETCDCSSRCEERYFSKSTSSLQWPHDEYLQQVLLNDICNKRNRTDSSDQICNTIDQKEVSSNFLAVVIYFEDLDYEVIIEEQLYNTLRFLSDIGGAMGLYIGASVLTYVELLQLALEVFLLCKRKLTRVADDKRILAENTTEP
jgi:amiloride-sensitive sodium channel subunit alpha/amiloride-sensitive sodium channel subunit gamma